MIIAAPLSLVMDCRYIDTAGKVHAAAEVSLRVFVADAGKCYICRVDSQLIAEAEVVSYDDDSKPA